MAMKKYTREEIEKMKDLTDYSRVKNMTEEEIRENAESDPHVPLQSKKSLKRFKRIKKLRGKRND